MADRNSRFPPALFAAAAIACFAYATLALVLMHLLRPDYSPADHMISEYAVGQYGWVMASCFVAMAAGCLALLLAFVRSGPGSTLAWAGTLLFAIPSIGLVVSALYPMDGSGTPPTRTGEIHYISFLVNVGSIFLATILLSISFRSARWHNFRRIAVALSSLIVVAFLLQFITIKWHAYFGLANRFFVAVLFAWFFATSIKLREISPNEYELDAGAMRS